MFSEEIDVAALQRDVDRLFANMHSIALENLQRGLEVQALRERVDRLEQKARITAVGEMFRL